MDDRIRRHAELLVDHCTDVGPADDVLVRAPTPAAELVEALYAELGERGARPTLQWRHPRAGRAYARAMDEADFQTKAHELAAMRETDVVVMVAGSENAAETSDVAPGKSAAASRARAPILEERLDSTRWVITQHPTAADAQAAGMSTGAWAEFVYGAVNRDWTAQRERQARVAERLAAASEVRLVSAGTDLRLDVDGMAALNDHATQNLPGGEVAISPVPDGVTGEVTFDLPLRRNGRELRDAHLTFEDGEVVAYDAARNVEVLESVLETDEGAKRTGELGIGTNRGIDRVTHNTLFDEKMGGTVHLALGNALEECVPDGEPFNESAAHVDLLVDVREDSRVLFDGETVLEDGVFWFEA
jgi:aminopeptidase